MRQGACGRAHQAKPHRTRSYSNAETALGDRSARGDSARWTERHAVRERRGCLRKKLQERQRLWKQRNGTLRVLQGRSSCRRRQGQVSRLLRWPTDLTPRCRASRESLRSVVPASSDGEGARCHFAAPETGIETMRYNSTSALNFLTALVAVAAVVLGGIRIYEFVVRRSQSTPNPVIVRNWRELAEGGIEIGSPSAPVTLVMFSDFNCIHCQAAAPAVKAVREEFGERLRFVYRNVPLGTQSLLPALIAVCGHAQGRFDAVHECLFNTRREIRQEDAARLPVALRVADSSRFVDCLTSDFAHAAIARDTAAAVALGLQGTPTFLVDSLLFQGNIGQRNLRRAVRASLGEREPMLQRLRELLLPRE